MKVVVFHGLGAIRLDDVTEPGIENTCTIVIDAYCRFDKRRPGWVKVEFIPAAVAA
jgi:hypothetical protein